MRASSSKISINRLVLVYSCRASFVRSLADINFLDENCDVSRGLANTQFFPGNVLSFSPDDSWCSLLTWIRFLAGRTWTTVTRRNRFIWRRWASSSWWTSRRQGESSSVVKLEIDAKLVCGLEPGARGVTTICLKSTLTTAHLRPHHTRTRQAAVFSSSRRLI